MSTCDRKYFRAQLMAKNLPQIIHEDDVEMNRDQSTKKCNAMCSELGAREPILIIYILTQRQLIGTGKFCWGKGRFLTCRVDWGL